MVSSAPDNVRRLADHFDRNGGVFPSGDCTRQPARRDSIVGLSATMVVVCALLMLVACGTRGSVSGTVLVLRPALTLTNEPARSGAAGHDASVISNRLRFLGCTQFGIRAAGDKITLTLPGPFDENLIANVVGTRGELAFYLVSDERSEYDALKAIDARYRLTTGSIATEQPAGLLDLIQTAGGTFAVADSDYIMVLRTLNASADAWPVGSHFLFGPTEAFEERQIRRLYMVSDVAVIQRPAVSDVSTSAFESRSSSFSAQVVSVRLLGADAARLTQLTALNVGRRIAIVVDSTVYSAPVIQSQVPDGRLVIMVSDSPVARPLAAALSSGPLDVKWRVDATRD